MEIEVLDPSKVVILKDPAYFFSLDPEETTERTMMTPNKFPKRYCEPSLPPKKDHSHDINVERVIKKQDRLTMHQQMQAFLLSPLHTTEQHLAPRLST